MPSHEILGIGSPFADHIVAVNEETLAKIPGAKGGMIAVDYPTLQRILEVTGSEIRSVLGGSGTNTIRGLSYLGHCCGLVGRVGTDALGKKFIESLTSQGVTSFLIQTPTPTGQALCLITPDHDRTMRSFLGASQEMSEKDLNPALFQGVRLVHIEGYTFMKGALAKRAMELAKEVGAKISLDLGSFEVVQAYRRPIIELVSKYVDIIFANADETASLTQLGPEKGCEMLRNLCEIAVVLLGEEGCYIGNKARLLHCKAMSVDVIDTTGAGDLFASGFLHGFLMHRTLEECAHYGTLTASAVVQVLGVDISPQNWIEIRSKMHG